MANSDIIKIGFDYRASLAQFEKDTNGVFDGISNKAGKQKITIQLDAKDDKVIDKIKELQKLKLDKFTFEFGESGLKEQLQTFDKLENKINEIINLSKNNLASTFKDIKKSASLNDLDYGTDKYNEELKRVTSSIVEMGKKGQESTREYFIEVQKLLNLYEIFRKKADGNLFSKNTSQADKFSAFIRNSQLSNDLDPVKDTTSDIFNGCLAIIDNFVDNSTKKFISLKDVIEKVISVSDGLESINDNKIGINISEANNSQIEELKSDIQEVKTELGDVKDRISSIESNGFENVRNDVEKTKESVKELNSELTEMKSNLSSTPQESNISSASNPAIESQNNYQKELSETKKLTDDNVSSMFEFIKLCQEQAKVLGETNEELKERAAYFKDEKISGGVSVGTHYAGNHDNSDINGANSDLHSHFSKYASFSENDLFNLKDTIKNFMVMGTDELTHLNTSGLSQDLLEQIWLRYDAAIKELNQQYFDNLNIKNNLKFTDVEDIPERILDKAFEFAENQSNIDYDYDKYDSFYENQIEKIRKKLLDGASLNDITDSMANDIKALDINGVESEIKTFQEKFTEGIRGYLTNILLENDVFNPDKLLGMQDYNISRNNALKSVLDDLGVGSDRLKTIDISNLEEGYSSLLKTLGLVVEKQNEVATVASQNSKKDAFPDKDISASVESVTNSIKEENNALEQNTQKVKENTQAKEQNANVNLNKYDKRLDSYQGKVNKYDTTIKRFKDGGWTSDAYLKNVQAVKDAVKKYEDLLNEIKAKGGIASEDDIQKLKEYEGTIKKTISTVTNMSASEKGYNFVSAQKELDKIHKLLNENSKMSSEAKAKIQAYYREIESGNPSMSLDKIHGEILKIYNAEVEAGRAGRTFFDTLKNSGFHQIAAQMAGMFGFYDVINIGKQAISTIVGLDDALVDLKKTTAMNETQLEDFYYDANDVAKQMGVTTEEIITQASAWSRLGYSSQEAATTMAKLSSKFASISPGMSTDEAQEGLVSIMKAFDINPDDVETEIMDKINVLGNTMAEDNQDIVEGMERSAAAMSAMGQSFTDTAALFTGGMEILQDSESMGTALRTLSMRVRGYDEETEQLSDDLVNVTGEVANLTKTAQDSQGVSLFTDATQEHYRSMVEYLGDIADRWDQISEKNQTQLLQQLFGKNRANESVCPYVQKCA